MKYEAIPANTVPQQQRLALVVLGIQRMSNYVVDYQRVTSDPKWLHQIPINPPADHSHTVYWNGNLNTLSIAYAQQQMNRMREVANQANNKRNRVINEVIVKDPFLPLSKQINSNGITAIFKSNDKKINKEDPNAESQWLSEHLSALPDCDASLITNEIHAHLMQLTEELNQAFPNLEVTYTYIPEYAEPHRGTMDKFQIAVFQRVNQLVATPVDGSISMVAYPVQPQAQYQPVPQMQYQPGVPMQAYPPAQPGYPPVVILHAPPPQQQQRQSDMCCGVCAGLFCAQCFIGFCLPCCCLF